MNKKEFEQKLEEQKKEAIEQINSHDNFILMTEDSCLGICEEPMMEIILVNSLISIKNKGIISKFMLSELFGLVLADNIDEYMAKRKKELNNKKYNVIEIKDEEE